MELKIEVPVVVTPKPSNMAIVREALEYASRVLAKWRQDAPFSAWNEYGEAIDKCRAALSAPPRNCDVGTAEEQAQRIDAFCKSHGTDKNGYYRCEECPLLKIDRCELKWAQMPYNESEVAV